MGLDPGWYEGDPWPPSPPPGLLGFQLSTFNFQLSAFCFQLSAFLSLIPGRDFRGSGGVAGACPLLEQVIGKIFLPLPPGLRLGGFDKGDARLSPVISIQLKPTPHQQTTRISGPQTSQATNRQKESQPTRK